MKGIDVGKRMTGINFLEADEAEVLIWSPGSTSIAIKTDNNTIPLQKEEPGYWHAKTKDIKPGTSYKVVVNDDKEFPDPSSLLQPEGVHGHSKAIRLDDFKWTDQHWNNPSLNDYIIYELHTGTFTPEGTFSAIEQKLDYLKELGVNAIEIMPVAEFPGSRNWGYDGVFPFAVHHAYGGPQGLQHLVNACHEKDIAVILDVVYNHLGPEGNYLGAYGPVFTDKYKTPWGGAINFDDEWCNGVRNYFIENALMWFRDFHIDALRLDAVHAIKDLSPVHILKEIKQYTDKLMQHTGKSYHLIVELDLNDPKFIDRLEDGGYGMDAQWIDEFHHALRVSAGGERNGYYSDFNGIQDLAKSFKDAYVYDGQWSEHRKRTFGIKTSNPGQQFIVFSQNHDQVGNRMLGERTSVLTSFEMQKLLAGAVMVSPYIPMLFMGEEYSEPHPFLYFVSHTDPDLAEAVYKGRKAEFAAFHAEGEAPDPMSEHTFNQSKLQWELIGKDHHQVMLNYYKHLISLRKKLAPLHNNNRKQLHVSCTKDVLTLHRWEKEEELICFMNFSRKEQPVMIPSNIKNWYKLLDSATPEWNGPSAAPETISGGTPGSAAITLQPESILLYMNRQMQ